MIYNILGNILLDLHDIPYQYSVIIRVINKKSDFYVFYINNNHDGQPDVQSLLRYLGYIGTNTFENWFLFNTNNRTKSHYTI